MKRLLAPLLLLLTGLPLFAADSTIGNLSHISTVPDAYRMPWEQNGIQDYFILFSELTNQVLAGYAGQSYATAAAHDATNTFPWGVLYDPAGAAKAATNPIPQMIGAIVGGSNFVTAGVTNGLLGPNSTNDLRIGLQAYSQSLTQGFVGAGVTNGLGTDASQLTTGTVPMGRIALATNGYAGPMLTQSNGVARYWSYNGAALTNLNAANVVGQSLDYLTDVMLGSAGLGDFFSFNGTYWTNSQNGSSLTNLNAANLTGTVPEARSAHTMTNLLSKTPTEEGPVLRYNTVDHTNGSYSDASGQIHSNAVGWVKTSGGVLSAGPMSGGVPSGTNFVVAMSGNQTNAGGIQATQFWGNATTATSASNIAGQAFTNATGSVTFYGDSFVTTNTTDKTSMTWTNGVLVLRTNGVVTISLDAKGANATVVDTLSVSNIVSSRGSGYFYLKSSSPSSVGASSFVCANSYGFTGSEDKFHAVAFSGGETMYSLGGTVHLDGGGLAVSGTLAVTNGVVSNSRRLLAPVAITVSASPFVFYNSLTNGVNNTGGTNNIFVFIDGMGVTGTVALNGTQIFGSLGFGATIPLQPGEYITLTYSIGTPTATWKPF